MAQKEKKPIYVTQPDLPPLNEIKKYLNKIWRGKILTNNGPFHQEFEERLADYLGVRYVSLFSNGTLALLTALKALNIKGEVITTPFSFVATSHALLWNGLTPVFADIEPVTFTLDPDQIEGKITSETSAILPVHVYGYPCKVHEIQKIAEKHRLKVIYDAAHTFGARYNGQSICDFGDLSVLSFHATKVFNTFEGGAIVSHDPGMKAHIDNLKNFGFTGEITVTETGINAKMNEFQAAFGLLQLKYIDKYIQKRKFIYEIYLNELSGIKGIDLPPYPSGLQMNYAYFPIFIKSGTYGKTRDEIYDSLKEENIFTRRYFYPLITKFLMYSFFSSASPENLPNAERIAGEVLCLPIYPELKKHEVMRIVNRIVYRKK